MPPLHFHLNAALCANRSKSLAYVMRLVNPQFNATACSLGAFSTGGSGSGAKSSRAPPATAAAGARRPVPVTLPADAIMISGTVPREREVRQVAAVVSVSACAGAWTQACIGADLDPAFPKMMVVAVSSGSGKWQWCYYGRRVWVCVDAAVGASDSHMIALNDCR